MPPSAAEYNRAAGRGGEGGVFVLPAVKQSPPGALRSSCEHGISHVINGPLVNHLQALKHTLSVAVGSTLELASRRVTIEA